MEQQTSPQTNASGFIKAVHGIRYQVKDVARSVAFYTQRLGFTLKHQQLPAFANVSRGPVTVKVPSMPSLVSPVPLALTIPEASARDAPR